MKILDMDLNTGEFTMKTLAISLMAAAFVLAASGAFAGMASHELVSLDSSHHAVVSISEASSPIAASAGEVLSFDSQGLWTASDYTKVSSGSSMSKMASGSSVHEKMYCFDSLSRFCAVAY